MRTNSDRKIERMTKTIDRQRETINRLESENESLKEQLEIEKSLNEKTTGEMKESLKEIRLKKAEVNREYENVQALKEQYREIIVEISELKKEYGKELKGLVKKAKKEVK